CTSHVSASSPSSCPATATTTATSRSSLRFLRKKRSKERSHLSAPSCLHGMEERIKQFAETMKGNKSKNRRALSLIRYADDFVIMHKDQTVVEECQKIISKWLNDMGLELKPNKTKVTHTFDGFDFLGFNIRQYKVGKNQSKQGFKTIIKPSKEKVLEHYRQLSKVIDKYRAAPQEALIRQMKPIIRGWCNYYSSVCSKETLAYGHATRTAPWDTCYGKNSGDGEKGDTPKNQ
ncbi:MAG: hypothetical protein F6K10_27555, partial [Moorea sp. SIO2B7]|nr:hypothetical protein [Moorena sp. SIO2B7]